MPRTPKICGHPGKPKCLKTATKQGRCTDHQIAPYEGARQRWKASKPPGYEALRRRVIREAEGLCEIKDCTTPGLPVDHIIPVAQGGSWARENLQLLCTHHHDIKSKQDARRGLQRRRR